jgi:integrase
MSSNITTPKLCKSSARWYVYFSVNGKQKRYTGDLNRIKDLKERQTAANTFIKELKSEIASGWLSDTQITETNYTLIDALNFSLEKKKEFISTKTFHDYKNSLSFVFPAIKSIRMEHLYIKDTRRVHVKLILERVKKDRKWSNKSYNKNLSYLSAIFNELLQWDLIETNPCYKIKRLKEEDSVANRPATSNEVLQIKKHLQNKHLGFYRFVVTIFHTGIRPVELTRITVGMVNLNNQTIIMPAHITKGRKKQRVVPINHHLLKEFEAMDLSKYPEDFYLFGRIPTGKRGRNRIEFLPASGILKRDTPNRNWNTLVKKDLGIDVNLYAMKHTGANAKILAGIDLEALRDLYGHQSKLMTLRYAKVVKEVNRKMIIDQSPDF